MDKKQKANLTNAKVENKTLILMGLLGNDPGKSGQYDANWSEVDPSLVIWLISCVCAADGAVMFGKSRRGDQYHVRVLAGEKAQNFWFAGNYEGRQLFEEWCRAFCAAIEESLG